MISTLSGYAGGTTEAPTYRAIGDHSETVRVIFDPEQISYRELLEVFWQLHDPSARPYLNQYRNAIFTLDEEQHRVAVASSRALAQTLGRPVNTPIEKAGHFTPAEDYHQKHYLKGPKPLLELLRERYPDSQQLFRSTEAARLNGYLGCNAEPEQLGPGLRALDLPVTLERELFDSLTLTCRNYRGVGCVLPPRQ